MLTIELPEEDINYLMARAEELPNAEVIVDLPSQTVRTADGSWQRSFEIDPVPQVPPPARPRRHRHDAGIRRGHQDVRGRAGRRRHAQHDAIVRRALVADRLRSALTSRPQSRRRCPALSSNAATHLGEGWYAIAFRVPDAEGDWALRLPHEQGLRQATGHLQSEAGLLPLLEASGLPTPRAARAIQRRPWPTAGSGASARRGRAGRAAAHRRGEPAGRTSRTTSGVSSHVCTRSRSTRLAGRARPNSTSGPTATDR